MRLAGPSNAGFTEPGQCTALSLAQVSTTLGILKPTLDNNVVLQMMAQLVHEIAEAFGQAHERQRRSVIRSAVWRSFRRLLSALPLFTVSEDFTNRLVWYGSMGQLLGLASISEARASACVSIYSRMFVSLPFRTVMSKTQWSSNVLFVALIFPVATPTTRTRSPCATNSGGSGYVVSISSDAF